MQQLRLNRSPKLKGPDLQRSLVGAIQSVLLFLLLTGCQNDTLDSDDRSTSLQEAEKRFVTADSLLADGDKSQGIYYLDKVDSLAGTVDSKQSDTLHDQIVLRRSDIVFGEAMQLRGQLEYEQAIVKLELAIGLAEQIDLMEHKRVLAKYWFFVASCYRELDKPLQAVEAYEKVKEISMKIDLPRGAFNALNGKALVLESQNKLAPAFETYQEMIGYYYQDGELTLPAGLERYHYTNMISNLAQLLGIVSLEQDEDYRGIDLDDITYTRQDYFEERFEHIAQDSSLPVQLDEDTLGYPLALVDQRADYVEAYRKLAAAYLSHALEVLEKHYGDGTFSDFEKYAFRKSEYLNKLAPLELREGDDQRAEKTALDALKWARLAASEGEVSVMYAYATLGEIYKIRYDREGDQDLSRSFETLEAASRYYEQALTRAIESGQFEVQSGAVASLQEVYHALLQVIDQVEQSETNTRPGPEELDQLASSCIERLIELDTIAERLATEEEIQDERVEEELAEIRTEQLQGEKEKAEALAKLEQERSQRNRILLGITLLFLLAAVYGVIKIRKERKKSDELLHAILPEDIAAELKLTNKVEPVKIPDLNIMFTDIQGFTSYANESDPRELVEKLDKITRQFDIISQKRGVDKLKTIGDAYMAVSGLSQGREIQGESSQLPTNASNIVMAALEMQEWITTSMPDLPMRIGIHSGDVVAGVIGGDKFQYDIRGDAVNIAARSESVGKPAKVNITHALYEKVKGDERFCFKSRGGVDVKGIEVPIEMYFVSKKGGSE